METNEPHYYLVVPLIRQANSHQKLSPIKCTRRSRSFSMNTICKKLSRRIQYNLYKRKILNLTCPKSHDSVKKVIIPQYLDKLDTNSIFPNILENNHKQNPDINKFDKRNRFNILKRPYNYFMKMPSFGTINKNNSNSKTDRNLYVISKTDKFYKNLKIRIKTKLILM